MESHSHEANRVTLNSYEEKLDEYIAGSPQTVDGTLKKFIKA